jgi:hypothetical protein
MDPPVALGSPRSIAEPDNVDLLFRYYQVLKQDLLLQMGSFKNHVRNSQIVGTAFLTIMSFLLTNKNYALSEDNVGLWLVVMATFTTVTYYLIHDVLEAVFAVRALEECLSFLEDRVNAILGANRLVWQSGVAQKLWPSSTKVIGFFPPMLFLQIYETLLIAGATIILPGFVYYKAWGVSGSGFGIRALLIGLALYSVISAGITVSVLHSVNNRLRSKVRDMINAKWEYSLVTSPEKTERVIT